jgi:hypothetical protein
MAGRGKTMSKIDTKKILLHIKILQDAVEIAEKTGRFIAVKNSFRALAHLFSPVPDRVQKVIIFYEKHGNLHYDASTNERLWWACYDVLKNRNELGYWYGYLQDLPDAPDYPMPPTTPLEAADEAEEPIAKVIRGMWRKYNTEVKEIDGRYEDRALLLKALASEGKDSSAKRFLDTCHEEYTIECISSQPKEAV